MRGGTVCSTLGRPSQAPGLTLLLEVDGDGMVPPQRREGRRGGVLLLRLFLWRGCGCGVLGCGPQPTEPPPQGRRGETPNVTRPQGKGPYHPPFLIEGRGGPQALGHVRGAILHTTHSPPPVWWTIDSGSWIISTRLSGSGRSGDLT